MGESYTGNASVIKVDVPKRKDLVIIRFLIVCGIFLMTAFLWWFIDPDHVGFAPVFWLLTLALVFKLMKMLHEWYHYWNVSVPVAPEMKTQWKVDMLTTACPGEPKDMIINTLKAMQAVRYPHTSYLCDESDDPELREVCRELGVVHCTRTEKVDAKAGNINNALKQATGDICVVLDPDHVPVPEFLDRVLPYFEDEKVGYVQVVQAYGNQSDSLIALGAAEQTYHFYGPMMMCMHKYGTVQAIGANCTFRRAALDSIGGHAPGLSEDMHTAMRIHAKGWKSVYVPEVLSRGLVPSTMPAYYKQQLKWSRGTFDLLFKVYPRLFRNFTWRQKLHYLVLPLYFLFGLVNFIDIMIPVACLALAEVPWAVDIENFAWLFVPLCLTSLMIRVYAQRWLLEEHEKGFHLAGGLLRTGTWWIFLTGFIYTLLDIKVPYIPTPKNDEPVNNWKLGLPNLIACLVSIGAVIYGLSIDWSPYSLTMAGFAMINAGILGFVFILGQEKLIRDMKRKLSRTWLWDNIVLPVSVTIQVIRKRFYGLFRNGSLIFAVVAAVLFLNYTKVKDPIETSLYAKKNVGGFYTGIYISELEKDGSLDHLRDYETGLNTSFDIISLHQQWGPESIEKFPMELLRSIDEKGAIPMITWEPVSSTFPHLSGHPDLSHDRRILSSVNDGMFDMYLRNYATKIREFGKPVFINFAPEPDNPAHSWSLSGDNTAKEYKKAWEHIVTVFIDNGVSNVTWVWNPWKPEAIREYYPGPNYVDWIGVTALNYGDAGKKKPRSFARMYEPFRKVLRSDIQMRNKPVMITELGAAPGNDRTKWLEQALADISKKYSEISSVVFYNKHEKDKKQAIDWSFSDKEIFAALSSKLAAPPFIDKPLKRSWLGSSQYAINAHGTRSAAVKGADGDYQLYIDGKPYYIKGVAYNPAHDWRDGNYPLTRKQLVKDFGKIKAMGANTIRRYHPGFYDRNILNIAEENDLKVLYGFWFDPKTDFFTDSMQMKKYIREVEETVTEYKDHKSVLGWSLGNESWGLLKHKYGQPYLSQVRKEYVRFVEYLAQRIHAIDPGRPVFTVMEHSWQLPSEVAMWHDNAPSIDIIGVNSYYEQQISKLDNITTSLDPGRPYLVSEFGPKGYWNPDYSDLVHDTVLVEAPDADKASLYVKEWTQYVEGNKGKNIGGFAYCWRDRMEGTNTWFGLTDYKGREKQQYLALQKEWTKHNENAEVAAASIIMPRGELLPGNTYVFTASVKGNAELEWFMHKNEYLDKVDGLKVLEGGRKVMVKIPSEPADYRIYLYAGDGKGHVVTASQAVTVHAVKSQ